MPEIDPLKRKAYVSKHEKAEYPENRTKYWFCELPTNAAHWESRAAAENARSILNMGVNVPSAFGGTYECRDFTIEEIAEDKFLIFCTGPFIYDESRPEQAAASAASGPQT